MEWFKNLWPAEIFLQAVIPELQLYTFQWNGLNISGLWGMLELDS